MYDFHLGVSADSASKVDPSLSLSFEIHGRLGPQLRDIGLLSRMSDHYEDCEYGPEEFSELLKCLSILLATIQGNPEIEFVNNFLKLVKEAQTDSHSIYGFCD